MPMLFSPTIGAVIAAHARSSLRCRSDQPYPLAVLPRVPAERTVCRVGPAVAPLSIAEQIYVERNRSIVD
jgi:hypothetical protein